MPTTWPRLLIAVAAPAVSPGAEEAPPCAIWFPYDGPKLQDLGRPDAGWILYGVFGPADDLAPVVGAGGEAVVAAQRGKLQALSPPPDDSETGETGACRARKEGGATPAFPNGSGVAVWEMPTISPRCSSRARPRCCWVRRACRDRTEPSIHRVA